jgi:hypothetical protein
MKLPSDIYSFLAENQVMGSGNRAYYSAKVQFPAPSSGTMPSDKGHFLNWKKVIKLFAQLFILHDFQYFANYLIEEKDIPSRFRHCQQCSQVFYYNHELVSLTTRIFSQNRKICEM